MTRPILLLLLSMPLLPAAGSDRSGSYAGEWKSRGTAGSGSFRMTLTAQADDGWKCEVGFSFGGEDIKTTMRACTVGQSQLEATYDFEIQGMTLRSKTTGQWNGKAFTGEYQTTTADGSGAVDDGSWTASPHQE